MSRAYDELKARLTVAMPLDSVEAALKLLDKVIEETRVTQARVDADLMQKMSDRAANTTPPKGGTNSRSVYKSAANMLNPDELGWSLKLPAHLQDGTEKV